MFALKYNMEILLATDPSNNGVGTHNKEHMTDKTFLSTLRIYSVRLIF